MSRRPYRVVSVNVNRRALLGLGVFGASIVGTLGAAALLDDQPARPRRVRRREGEALSGLAPEIMRRLLRDPGVEAALRRRNTYLDKIKSSQLGDDDRDLREMDYLLVPEHTPYYTPGALPLFTSPLVLHARPAVAEGLARDGWLQADAGRTFVDTLGLLNGDAPFALGEPSESDAAWLFAGLAAGLMGGPAPAMAALSARVDDDDDIEAFMDAEPTAAPARVGFECDLPRWISDDPARWAKLQASRADAVPVTLYLRPTVYASWELIPLKPRISALSAVLHSREIRTLAGLRYGLRGPNRESAVGEAYQAFDRLPPAPVEVLSLFPNFVDMKTLVEALAD